MKSRHLRVASWLGRIPLLVVSLAQPCGAALKKDAVRVARTWEGK